MSSHIYEFGHFHLDPDEEQLLFESQAIPITKKPFQILKLLVENHQRLVRRERIMKEVWPITYVDDSNVDQHISTIRKILRKYSHEEEKEKYIKTESSGFRFEEEVVELTRSIDASAESVIHADSGHPPSIHRVQQKVLGTSEMTSAFIPEPLLQSEGGAVPLDSPFYVVRPTDGQFYSAIENGHSIVLVKGARQMGKTSLMARGLERARRSGAQVILTDFQELNSASLESVETLFKTLAALISDDLDLDYQYGHDWNEQFSSNRNFERFLRKRVFSTVSAPLVWGLDEVDRLFGLEYASEVFGLFRSWHNKRALEPAGPWQRLTLVISYATEAHLFIRDRNQSPFNVGTRLELQDFDKEYVEDLNRKYGSPLTSDATFDRFYRLVGGHPYLVRSGLHALADGLSLAEFERQATSEDGVYGDHLRRLLFAIKSDPILIDTLREILVGKGCSDRHVFFRLRSGGVLSGASHADSGFRCFLYRRYLQENLVSGSAPASGQRSSEKRKKGDL